MGAKLERRGSRLRRRNVLERQQTRIDPERRCSNDKTEQDRAAAVGSAVLRADDSAKERRHQPRAKTQKARTDATVSPVHRRRAEKERCDARRDRRDWQSALELLRPPIDDQSEGRTVGRQRLPTVPAAFEPNLTA
jgi:hypothetical protein